MLNTEVFYELMKEKEIPSLSALSRLTKIPYTTINYMLTGHDMHVGTLVELSKFFDVPIDYLINKSYGVVVYTNEASETLTTSSLIEAFMSTTL